jgi:hypothetical protein
MGNVIVEYRKNWDKILFLYLIQIKSIEELIEYPLDTTEIEILINSIFSTLKRLNAKYFLNEKEIETTFILIKEEISYLNDILMSMNIDALVAVYELILAIFEALIVGAASPDIECYELSTNLQRIRDYWFSNSGIKIVNDGVK